MAVYLRQWFERAAILCNLIIQSQWIAHAESLFLGLVLLLVQDLLKLPLVLFLLEFEQVYSRSLRSHSDCGAEVVGFLRH